MLPVAVNQNLEKCRSAVIAAVDTFNRPGPRFRTACYIVLVVIAWTALLHAVFYKKGTKPIGDRYIRIEDDPKHWDLAERLMQHNGTENPPERKNLEILVGLRHKIEHRHVPDLDAGLYGECQAAPLNLENLIAAECGSKYSMTEQLSFR